MANSSSCGSAANSELSSMLNAAAAAWLTIYDLHRGTVHVPNLDDDGAVWCHVVAHKLVVAQRARLPARNSARGLLTQRRGSAGAAGSWACPCTAARHCCSSAPAVHAVRCRAWQLASAAAADAARCVRHRRPATMFPQGSRRLSGAGGSDKAGQSVRCAVQQPAVDSTSHSLLPLRGVKQDSKLKTSAQKLLLCERPLAGAAPCPSTVHQASNAKAPLQVLVALCDERCSAEEARNCARGKRLECSL